MQIGVYGAGYLGTVVSACLADFGTPVICCHPDSSQMVEMAQGNVPFHEKNLTEVIKRNVRSGRLAYSTDIESFARKAQVIFLAEDSPQHLSDLAIRIATAASKPPILTIVTPVSVGTASAIEQSDNGCRIAGDHWFRSHVLYSGCAIEDFNWPDRIILGTASNEAVLAIKQIFHSAGDARGSGDSDQSRDRGTGARVRDCICGDQNFFHQRTRQPVRTSKCGCGQSFAGFGLDKKIAPRCLQPGARHGRAVRRVRYGFAGRTGAAQRRVAENPERRARSESRLG